MKEDSKTDELIETLRQRINQGIYTSGQQLPSERELMEEFNVSRSTIRTALQRLQSENIIDVIPRAGAFVRSSGTKITLGPTKTDPHKASGLELKRAGSFVRAMEALGRQVLVRFIEPSSIIPMGPEIALKMNNHPNTKVLRRYRVQLVDRIPYRILDSYYLESLLGGLLGQDETYVPLFKWMYDHTGERAAKAYEKINIRMPTAEEAALLNISRSQPVIDMDRLVWTNKETLFEYTRMIANATLHEIAYNYEIDEEASK